MAVRMVLPTAAAEGCTYRILGTITDEAGNALPAASITTLTLTLHKYSGGIINSVDAVNILNTGRGVVDGAGNLTLTLLPADNPIVGPADGSRRETHVALLEWTYAAGVKAGKAEIEFPVEDLSEVP